MTRIEMRIAGLAKVVQKLNLERPAVQVLEKYLTAAAVTVAGEARRRAPVDTSRLRTSINHKVETQGNTVTASIGTNVTYAPYMEFGTGLVHDHPSWPRKRHVVPAQALAAWAMRKGRGGKDFDAFTIARAISRRGGLMPRRYLRGALEAYEGAIRANIAEVGKRIRDKAGL